VGAALLFVAEFPEAILFSGNDPVHEAVNPSIGPSGE